MHAFVLSLSARQAIVVLAILLVNPLAWVSPALHAQARATTEPMSTPAEPLVEPAYEPFTGKITRNKVRVRLQPSLDALILTELNRDTLLSIVGEVEEFYAVLPLRDTKAYIFRTLVLDGVVEGNRVNVRLEPALEAPVIAQLNQGDRIEGNISALNSKWFEIAPPATTRFYVCKEYVEKAGGPAMIQELEKRSAEVERQLKRAYAAGKKEMQKRYDSINWEGIANAFNQIIHDYTDFPSQVSQAQNLLAEMQKGYLQKKVSYLEAQVSALNESSAELATSKEAAGASPAAAAATPSLIQSGDAQLEEEQRWNSIFDSAAMTAKMAAWIPVEKFLYDQWTIEYQKTSPYQFYQQQALEQVHLRGMIEPYARVVRNKPGDYLLVNQASSRPIAYLYSTKVNLQEKVGQEITLYGIKRANNNFAFPAYFILSVE